MKALIFTEGGSAYGYGHIARCSSLYRELERRGAQVEIIFHGDNAVKEALNGYKYRQICWMDLESLRTLLNKQIYAIIDSHLAGYDIYDFISKNTRKSLYFDEDMRLNYPKGIVINPCLYAKELNYTVMEGKNYLLGKDYVILRDPFINCGKKEIKYRPREILITLGGSDVRSLTPLVLNLLKSNYPDLKKNVIVGTGSNNINEIHDNKDENTIMYYNVSAKEMSDLMLKSDMAICAAGQTIHEMIKTGIPFIPIQVTGEQIYNMKGLLKYKLINGILNGEDDGIVVRLLEEVRNLIKFENRRAFNKKLTGLIDGLGSSRAIDALLEK